MPEDANILIQAMATTGFWIKVAFILVFGGGWFACYWAATKAEQAGNRRRAIILGIAGIAIAIAGFVIEDHFDIFSDDDDDNDDDDDDDDDDDGTN
jgi:4-hydroxybenzoate polyprenyltransferase